MIGHNKTLHIFTVPINSNKINKNFYFIFSEGLFVPPDLWVNAQEQVVH